MRVLFGLLLLLCLAVGGGVGLTLDVDDAYCVSHGGKTVECIQAAVVEANQTAADRLNLAGTYDGVCPGGGIVVEARDLLLTTPSWPNLPPVDSPEAAIVCNGTGRPFHFSNSHNVTVAGLGFVRGGASKGGCVAITNSNLALVSTYFARCSTTTSGGAVYAVGSNVTLQDSLAVNCSASSSGGFVFLEYSMDFAGVFTITRSTIRECEAHTGGAAHLGQDTHLVVTDSVIDDCNATTSGGALIADDKSVTSITNVTISGCKCENGGGGIAVSDTAVLTVTNSTFTRNTAFGLMNNGLGGGISASGGSQVAVEGTIFDSNVGNKGGAISVEGGTQASVRNCTFRANVAGFEGGSLHVNGPLTKVVARHVVFLSGQAVWGGALYAWNDATVVLQNAECIGNSATFGGCLSVEDGNLTVTSMTITNGTAQRGGAIDGHRRSDRLTVTLADVHVSGCVATDTGGAVFLTAAGLGAVVDGTLAMAACTFYDNAANYGGAVAIDRADSVSISDSIFGRNTAGSDGGAISCKRAPMVLTGVDFDYSYAYGNGGTVYSEISDTLFNGTTILFSHSDLDGGGLYALSSDVTMHDSSIANTNGRNGGGIAFVAKNTQLRLAGGSGVYDGSAKRGGCIHFGSADSVTAQSVLPVIGGDGTGVLDLCVAEQSGGGIFAAATPFNQTRVENITVRGGTASLAGGGIFVDVVSPLAEVVLANVTVRESQAETVGGGVAVIASFLSSDAAPDDVPPVAIRNVVLEFNTARRGAGLQTNVRTDISGSTFRSNTAFANGGAVAVEPLPCLNVSLRVESSLFITNTAEDLGGGIYSYSTNIGVTTSSFTSNTATSGGGLAIVCPSETCNVAPVRDSCNAVASFSSSMLLGNSAIDGGGIYVDTQTVQLDPAGLPPLQFGGNLCDRGCGLFVANSASVYLGGVQVFDYTLLGSLMSGPNAKEYGSEIASDAAVVTWVAQPESAMAGTNMCTGSGAGCTIRLFDGFNNTVSTPSVVELVAELASMGGPDLAVVGPTFVLINADAHLLPAPEPTAVPFYGVTPATTDLAVLAAAGPISAYAGLRDPSVAQAFSDQFYLQVNVGACDAGYGTELNSDGLLVCALCGEGSFSDTVSWAPCVACEAGTTTAAAGGAQACTWCDAGYGWTAADGGGGSCAPCTSGTFSEAPTQSGIPCDPCAEGLTTSGDGAVACTVALNPGGSVGGVLTDPGTGVDVIVIVVTAVMAIVGAVALAISCLRKRDARHGAIGTVLLSLYDVITDYLFLFTMINENDDGAYTTLITIAAASIGAAFVVNGLVTGFVLVRERRRLVFSKWMRENVVVVAISAVLGFTNVSVLGALSSEVFDTASTRAPLSPDTLDLITFGGIASVLFEDLPQLVVAIRYAVLSQGADVSGGGAVVLLTILASAASVLTGLVLRLILCCVVGVDADDGGDDRERQRGGIGADQIQLEDSGEIFQT